MQKYIFMAFAVLLTGCNQTTPFKKAELSGVSSGEVFLWLPSSISEDGDSAGSRSGAADSESGDAAGQELIVKFLKGDTDAKDKLEDRCHVPPKKDEAAMRPHAVSPVVLPIITALGRLAFDTMMDQRARSLDNLKKRSVQTYRATEIFRFQKLRAERCLGIARITKSSSDSEPDQLGMIALFEIVHFNEQGELVGDDKPRDTEKAVGMRIRPVFVRSFNAVAVTKQGDGDEPAQISLSFALALKSIEHPQGKLARVVVFGAGAMSVPKVSLGGKTGQTKLCDDKCGSTGLMPLPPVSGPVELSVAVTETGDVGFDIDLAKAQNAAFKAAMGPAFGSALKTVLEGQ